MHVRCVVCVLSSVCVIWFDLKRRPCLCVRLRGLIKRAHSAESREFGDMSNT